MLEDAKIYLNQRAKQLDLGRGQALAQAQSILEARYPGKARALSLNDGVLKLVTASAAVAGELRLHQVNLIKEFEEAINFKYPITRLLIHIRQT